MIKQTINFKNDYDKDLIFTVHPLLGHVIFDAAAFCAKYNYVITITETRTDLEIDKSINRKSSTHRTGRACDLRTSDMPKTLRRHLIEYLKAKYENIAAVNAKLEPKLVVDECDHLHVQIHSRYALTEFPVAFLRNKDL